MRCFLALAALLFASSQALADVRVLTSIKPLQLIAAAVQDGLGQPEVLLPPGASPHHFALRPSDMRKLQQAELFYWIGPDLEGFLAKPLASRTATTLAVQQLDGLQLRHFGEPARPADHDHDHDHDHDQHESAHDEHDHQHQPGTLDAHLWLLPANAQRIAQRMASDLAALDPQQAARYQANADAFAQRLSTLDQHLQARLAPLQGKPFFVFHQAFDYFEQAYGLQHRGVFNLLGEVQPGARHVALIRQQLQSTGPSCLFSEPPLRPRLLQTLGEGLPVRMAELDALGYALAADAEGYPRLLENLAENLAGCLEHL